MEMTQMLELVKDIVINGLFPIVLSLILLKQNNQQREDHKKETSELSKIVEQNTLVTQHLADVIGQERRSE